MVDPNMDLPGIVLVRAPSVQLFPLREMGKMGEMGCVTGDLSPTTPPRREYAARRKRIVERTRPTPPKARV
jgi:hypothetical protein